MTKTKTFLALSSPLAIMLASCGNAATGESADVATASTDAADIFEIKDFGAFEEPWAIKVHPKTGAIFLTEQAGTMKFVEPASGRIGTVTGLPEVDYGGQGGLGDFAFAPDFTDSGMVYLSWAEAGEGNTRGAAVGRGTLVCEVADECRIDGLEVIWRQAPKVTGRGHYSHRLAFSPDGQHLFIASGDRQKLDPAQDNSNTLGTIVRLNLDGTPAAGNPIADNPEIWSYGHRNILGMRFAPDGTLWEIEHGPAGGDELNLVEPAANYGWPVRSYGDHYDGRPIADHSADDGFTKPAIQWTPVIAPGDMIFYTGDTFADWSGDLMITGLKEQALVRVEIDGESAKEVARYPMGARIRTIAEGADGAIWVAQDGEGGRLLRLTPKS